MATATLNDLVAFHKFLGERIKNGQCDFSVDQSVEAFHAYQRELEQLREELGPALQQSATGGTL